MEEFTEHNRSLPYNPQMNKRAKDMRRKMTCSEKKLWFCFLKNFNYKFYRQKVILHFIADFYCSKLKLVIEVDGAIHLKKDSIEYDHERTKCFESLGLKVIRFSNDEINNNFNAVCDKIIAIASNYLKTYKTCSP